MRLSNITVLTEDNKQIDYNGVIQAKIPNDKRGLVNVLLDKHPNATAIYLKSSKIWTK